MKTSKNNQDRLLDIFNNFTPTLSPEREFLQKMEKRLEVAEYIRQLQVKETQRHKRTICLAFVGGIAACFLFMTFIMPEPLSFPILNFSIRNIPFLLSDENMQIISSAFIAIALGAAICILSIIYQELADMRESYKSKQMNASIRGGGH